MKKTTPPATDATQSPDRIAKVIARAGLCSRREAESWIADGRVSLNGTVLATPAVTVKPGDSILVDGAPLPERDRTRLWLFHKPRGLVTTTHDPEGRPTVFSILPDTLPRVMTVGRLDINTEGLLLLTNDGGLARVLELPATGWLRRYRVRAHGAIEQAQLDALKDGVAIDGILYGSVEAAIDRKQGDNVWLTVGLREGKNREVKTILAHLGLDVNRLIRVSFGPFQLGELADGAVEEVPRRMLREQLGARLAAEAGADFELREGDRAPIQQKLQKAAKAAEAEEDEETADPSPRPRAPKAAASRRRHEADLGERPQRRQARSDEGGPAVSPSARSKASTGKAPAAKGSSGKAAGRTAPSERAERPAPNRDRNRLELKAEAAPADRRSGRLSRAATEASAEDAPKAYKSGKSFAVDRKPRSDKAPPARVRGDRSDKRPGFSADAAPAAKAGGRKPAAASAAAGSGKPRAQSAERSGHGSGKGGSPAGGKGGGKPSGPKSGGRGPSPSRPGGRDADRRR